MMRLFTIIALSAIVGFSVISAHADETAVNEQSTTSIQARRDPCVEFSPEKNKSIESRPPESKVSAQKQKAKTRQSTKR